MRQKLQLLKSSQECPLLQNEIVPPSQGEHQKLEWLELPRSSLENASQTELPSAERLLAIHVVEESSELQELVVLVELSEVSWGLPLHSGLVAVEAMAEPEAPAAAMARPSQQA